MSKDGGNSMREEIKSQIVAALSHPEAAEGLYFRNLWHLHEEDERPAVVADEVGILDALKELLEEGRVVMDETGKEVIFRLGSAHSQSLR